MEEVAEFRGADEPITIHILSGRLEAGGREKIKVKALFYFGEHAALLYFRMNTKHNQDSVSIRISFTICYPKQHGLNNAHHEI